MKSLQFFKGLSWLIILNMLVKPVWLFFIDRQVQLLVGYEDYGKYFAILNLSYVLFFLSDIGISNMLNQRMANHLPLNIGQLVRIKGVLLVIYFIVFCFVGWLTKISEWNILFYVIAIQALTSLLIFFRNIITANQYFGTDAWVSIIDKSLMIVFCGSILYTSFFGSMSLLLFLQVQTLCTAIAVILSFLFILRKRLVTTNGKENIETIIKFVTPFALITLLMSVHYRLDGFLLERIHPNGAMEAGIYASAYRLLDASNMVGYLASSFLVAFVARNLKDKEGLEDAIFNTRHLLMFCSLGAASFVIVFAPWLEKLLYHSTQQYNSLVIQLCIASFPGYCLVHVYGSVLTGSGKLRQFISILIVCVLLNVVLNIALIPMMGALSCCIAALASQYLCGVWTMVSASSGLHISYNTKSILIYLLFAALLGLFFYLGRNAMINVWIILTVAVFASLFVLITQLTVFRKYFISLR
jgi:O-antigen/teichoic acid export membrane protein